MNILSSLKSLLEKAKKPKKYHQDFVDLETWKKIITYVFETLNIEDEVIDVGLLADHPVQIRSDGRI